MPRKKQTVGVLLIPLLCVFSMVLTTEATLLAAQNQPAVAAAAEPPRLDEQPEPPLREPFPPGTLLTLDSPPGALAVQPDGKILVGSGLGGWFVDEQSGVVGWYARGVMRFESDGSVDPTFYSDVGRPGVSAPKAAHLDLQKDGRIFFCGFFDTVDNKPRPGYARLLPDGRLDNSFEPWRGRTNVPGRTFLPGGTFPAALLSDGSVSVMSGSVEGHRAPHPWTAYRLDASGRWIQRALTNAPAADWGYPPGLILTLGWSGFWARTPIHWDKWTELPRQYWMPRGSDRPPVVDLPFWLWLGEPTAAQAAIVFKALFEEVPIELCRYAVRMPDGGTVLAISDGTPIRTRGHLMQFDKDWRSVPGFATDFEADHRSALTLKRTPDGKFLFAGAETIKGAAFPGLVRLDEHGALDPSFHCETIGGPTTRVYDFAIQKDGRILICGDFTIVNGSPARHIARLNPDGSLDQTFKPPFVPLSEIQRRRSIRIARLSKARAANPKTAVNDGTTPGTTEDPAPETATITSMIMEPGRTTVHFKGKPGQLYILQAREPSDPAGWIKVNSVQARPDGTGILRDPQSLKNPSRLYRIATP